MADASSPPPALVFGGLCSPANVAACTRSPPVTGQRQHPAGPCCSIWPSGLSHRSSTGPWFQLLQSAVAASKRRGRRLTARRTAVAALPDHGSSSVVGVAMQLHQSTVPAPPDNASSFIFHDCSTLPRQHVGTSQLRRAAVRAFLDHGCSSAELRLRHHHAKSPSAATSPVLQLVWWM